MIDLRMTGHDHAIAVGIDPGATTGIAAWGPSGPVLALQDSERAALREMIALIRGRRDAVRAVVVERAWLGPGAHASLEVAGHVGFCRCAVWTAGYSAEPWVLMPSQWRSELGFPRTRQAAEAAAVAWASSHLGRRAGVHEAEALAMAAVAWDRWRLTGEQGPTRAKRARRVPCGGARVRREDRTADIEIIADTVQFLGGGAAAKDDSHVPF